MSKSVEAATHRGYLFFPPRDLHAARVYTFVVFPQNGSRRDTFIKRRTATACRAHLDQHVVYQLQKDLVEESGPLLGLSCRLFHRHGSTPRLERGHGFEVNCRLIFVRLN